MNSESKKYLSKDKNYALKQRSFANTKSTLNLNDKFIENQGVTIDSGFNNKTLRESPRKQFINTLSNLNNNLYYDKSQSGTLYDKEESTIDNAMQYQLNMYKHDPMAKVNVPINSYQMNLRKIDYALGYKDTFVKNLIDSQSPEHSSSKIMYAKKLNNKERLIDHKLTDNSFKYQNPTFFANSIYKKAQEFAIRRSKRYDIDRRVCNVFKQTKAIEKMGKVRIEGVTHGIEDVMIKKLQEEIIEETVQKAEDLNEECNPKEANQQNKWESKETRKTRQMSKLVS